MVSGWEERASVSQAVLRCASAEEIMKESGGMKVGLVQE